jgi:hypothetical protein
MVAMTVPYRWNHAGSRIGKASAVLADGRYDVIVVDATDAEDAIEIDLAVLSGPHKGEIVTVRAVGLTTESVDLLGTPATLWVADGTPRVELEP